MCCTSDDIVTLFSHREQSMDAGGFLFTHSLFNLIPRLYFYSSSSMERITYLKQLYYQKVGMFWVLINLILVC